MAQPFLISMDHSEWQSGSILRRHHQRRPLGDIERAYRYRPRQPVLSCRTVEVDLSGTRTYRAKTTGDIIDEQHKLIHTIYSQARNEDTNYQRRAYNQSGTGSNNSLRFLTVQGKQRPETSPVVGRPTSGHGNPSPGTGLKKRPYTTAEIPRLKYSGSRGLPVKPATETALKLQVDPDLSRTTEALYELNELVRGQWHPENHDLKDGFFVRGKKKENVSIDPKTGNQWLTFGGGQENSAGVVDAFTAMKQQKEYYTIEGSTGTQLAKRLKHTDKIQIGINGKEHKLKKHSRENSDTEDPDKPKTPRVPLCWTDQIEWPNTKVLEPSTPRPPHTKPNLCESHPVVFNKNIREYGVSQKNMKPKTSKLTEGYHFKSHTKKRRGGKGSESSSTITEISIDRIASENDGDQLTYDDIIALKLNGRYKEGNQRQIETPPKEEMSVAAIQNQQTRKLSSSSIESASDPSPLRKSSSSFVNSQVYHMDDDSEGRQGSASYSRPNSRYSLDMTDNDYDSLVVTSGTATVQSNGSKSPTHRASSGKYRPVPSKSTLHKSSSAQGSSISSSIKEPSTSYIQIAHQIHLNREPTPGSVQAMSAEADILVVNNSDVTDSISEQNMEFNKPPSPVVGHRLPTTPIPTDPILTVKEEDMEPTPVPYNTPPSTASSRQASDVLFAFNIPTADPEDPEDNSCIDQLEQSRPSASPASVTYSEVEKTATQLAETSLIDPPLEETDEDVLNGSLQDPEGVVAETAADTACNDKPEENPSRTSSARSHHSSQSAGQEV